MHLRCECCGCAEARCVEKRECCRGQEVVRVRLGTVRVEGTEEVFLRDGCVYEGREGVTHSSQFISGTTV